MVDSTIAARQAELRRRRKEQGQVRLEIWVHESNKEKLKEIAKELEEPMNILEAIASGDVRNAIKLIDPVAKKATKAAEKRAKKLEKPDR